MDKYLNKSLVYTSFIFLILVGIFTRSFLGISIFGFRLGELIVGGAFILSVYFLFISKPKKYFEIENSNFHLTHKLIIIYVVLRILLNYENINLYNFKSSSFIWTVAIIYIGIFISELSNNDLFLKLSMIFFPIIVYVFQTGNYPNIFISFFQQYSDKFQFMKASDMVIVVIISSIYISEYKRFQSAPGTRLSSRAFWLDRRYPITNLWRESNHRTSKSA